MYRMIWILMLGALLASTACERTPTQSAPEKVTPEDVRRDAGKALDTAVEFSQQAKEAFQKNLDDGLKELDAEIVKLRAKGSDLKDQAKTNWDQEMADLETKREAVRSKLAEVGQSTAEAWKDVQKGAQSAWDELDKAFRDASRKF